MDRLEGEDADGISCRLPATPDPKAGELESELEPTAVDVVALVVGGGKLVEFELAPPPLLVAVVVEVDVGIGERFDDDDDDVVAAATEEEEEVEVVAGALAIVVVVIVEPVVPPLVFEVAAAEEAVDDGL